MTLLDFVMKRKLYIAAGLLVFGASTAFGKMGWETANRVGQKSIVDFEVISFARSYNNSHLITTEGASVLIDAGLQEDAPALERDMLKRGFDPAKLKAIIVTHGHHDHAGGAAYFKDRYNIPVVAGRGDLDLIRRGQNDVLCPTNFFAKVRREQDQAGRYTGFEPDILIDDRISLKERTGIDLMISPLAGHTAGSLVITLNNAAFVGDLFRGGMLFRKATRHFYMCDMNDNDADMNLLMEEIAPQAKVFFTGHFGPISRRSVEKMVSKHKGRAGKS